VHLVVSTRADPAPPLALLRARGELVEVRSFLVQTSVLDR
jgi:LuxR family maltose regulon positive regulatory protein